VLSSRLTRVSIQPAIVIVSEIGVARARLARLRRDPVQAIRVEQGATHRTRLIQQPRLVNEKLLALGRCRTPLPARPLQRRAMLVLETFLLPHLGVASAAAGGASAGVLGLLPS